MLPAYCTNCGTALAPNVRFCGQCGTAAKQPSSTPPPPPPPPPNTTANARNSNTQNYARQRTNQPPQEHSVRSTTPPPKKKRKNRALRWFLTLGIIFAVLIGGWAIFKSTVSPSDQRRLFEDMGIEQTDFIESYGMESYVTVDLISKRQKLLENAWIVNGTLHNDHPSKTINTITLEFEFTDGSEQVTLYKKLNPQAVLKNPFRQKIYGHKNASFLSMRVVDAN